jgi:hypothetical protein
LSADDLLASVVDRVLAAVADSAKQTIVIVSRKLRANAEERGTLPQPSRNPTSDSRRAASLKKRASAALRESRSIA